MAAVISHPGVFDDLGTLSIPWSNIYCTNLFVSGNDLGFSLTQAAPDTAENDLFLFYDDSSSATRNATMAQIAAAIDIADLGDVSALSNDGVLYWKNATSVSNDAITIDGTDGHLMPTAAFGSGGVTLGTSDNYWSGIYSGTAGIIDSSGGIYKGYTSAAANVTATQLTSNKQWSVHKNTSSGEVMLGYNDSGTIKYVNFDEIIAARGLGFYGLTDPGADRILFWDDSAGSYTWLSTGEGLQISGTSILFNVSGLSEDGAPDSSALIPYYDGAGADHRSATIPNLLSLGAISDLSDVPAITANALMRGSDDGLSVIFSTNWEISSSGHLLPKTSSTSNLGSASVKLEGIHTNEIFFYDGSGTVSGAAELLYVDTSDSNKVKGSNIIIDEVLEEVYPTTNNWGNLGNATNLWASVRAYAYYDSGGSKLEGYKSGTATPSTSDFGTDKDWGFYEDTDDDKLFLCWNKGGALGKIEISDTYDIVVHGATGTKTGYNSTADTNASRGALLVSVVNNAVAGDEVVISAQTFNILQSLVPLSNVTLRGQGKKSLIVADYVGSSNGAIIAAGFSGSGYTGVTNLVLRDFAISVPTGLWNGICVVHGTDILIENIYATLGSTSSTYHAVDIMGCKNVVISKLFADTSSDSSVIQIDQATSTAAKGWNGSSEITITTADGTSCNGVLVEGCQLRSSATNTKIIHLHRDLHSNISIKNCIGTGGVHLVYLDDDCQLEGLIIEGVTFTSTRSGANGIVIYGGTTALIKGVVISNYEVNVSGYAMVLYDAEGVIVNNVTLRGAHASAQGILIRQINHSAGGNHLLSNIYLENTNGSNTATAIDVQSGMDEVRISNCHIEGYATGITGSGTNIRLAGVTYGGVTTKTTGSGITGGISTEEIKETWVQKSATYTITMLDYGVEATANTFSVNLPTAASISGRSFYIKNMGSGTVTVDGDASETIDGSTTKALVQYEGVKVTSNGTNWMITAEV